MSGTVRPPPSADPPTRVKTPRVAAEVHANTAYGPSSAGANNRRSVPDQKGEALPKICPVCQARYPVEFRVCPKDASELDDVKADDQSDPRLGTVLEGTYQIVRVIGEGGMGRVYEARHQRIRGKRFAIKMLHPEYARQADVLSRFQREAEASATIRSPYVVGVYDVDRTDDGVPYMVGEFLEGVEFAERLIEVGKLPVPLAVRICRQVCKGLSAAHKEGIIHRDMKPENVFLVGDPKNPTARVIDFGISKVGGDGKTNLTKTGMIMGTPSYMAPEQAKGDKIDHRVDVYAVGAMLYAALTGQRPFDRQDPMATLTAVLVEDPPPPRSLEPTIPESLELVIQRAMSKEPDDRFASMADLDAALAPWDTLGAGEVAGPPGPMSAARAPAASEIEVGMARPTIALLAGLGFFWLAAALTTLLSGFIRLARGKGDITGTEAFLLVLIVAFALGTPGFLAGRSLARRWGNTSAMVQLARELRLPVLVGFGAYGLAALLVRFFEIVLLQRAIGVAWPAWDVVTVLVGAIAVFVTWSQSRRV